MKKTTNGGELNVFITLREVYMSDISKVKVLIRCTQSKHIQNNSLEVLHFSLKTKQPRGI